MSRSRLYGLVVSTVLGNCAATPEPAVPDECLTPPDAAVSSADGAAEPPDDASEALLAHTAAEPGGPELARPEQSVRGPRILSAKEGHELLKINPYEAPYRVTVPPQCGTGGEYVAKIRICVSAEGKLTRVRLLAPTAPVLKEQIPMVLSRWVYQPLLEDGQPTPFCYAINYRLRPRKERSGWLF